MFVCQVSIDGMKNPGGLVVLAIIVVMLGSFALSTDQFWIRVGAIVGVGLAVATAVRSQRHG